jgi:hypothetical protein
VLREVLDALAEVPLRPIRLPRFPYAPPSPSRSPTSFAIAGHCARYSKFPQHLIRVAEVPRTHCPAPLGRHPPLQSPGAARGIRWLWNSAPSPDTRCRGSRTHCPPSPGPTPPLQSPVAHCGSRWPWNSAPANHTLCRRCDTPTQHSATRKSAWRLPPPWPRAPELPRPASRQYQQAAIVYSTARQCCCRSWPLRPPSLASGVSGHSSTSNEASSRVGQPRGRKQHPRGC